jgi:hypothetical protein
MAKAKHDPLIAALLAKLPSDGAGEWQQDARITWLQMMAMAFDAVYGRCGAIAITAADAPDAGTASPALAHACEASATPRPRRFTVDHDGFAMCDGHPIGFDDLPANAVLWDERTGIDRGDPAAILWRDIGASRQTLPPGVVLRVVHETMPASLSEVPHTARSNRWRLHEQSLQIPLPRLSAGADRPAGHAQPRNGHPTSRAADAG